MTFYVLKDSKPEADQTDFTTDYLPRNQNLGQATYCKVCGDLIKPRSWLPPYEVELELWGIGFGDMAFFFTDILVSEHFKRTYEEYGLKGLEGFEPAKVVRVKKHRRFKGDGNIPSYYHTTVVESKTAIDDIRSGMVRKEGPICDGCGSGRSIKRVKAIIVKPRTWTGEDIFTAFGLPGVRLATEKFKSFCVEYSIKNAVLLPAEEYGYNLFPWEE